MASDVLGTEAVVDLAVIRHNVDVLKSGTPAEVMAVVKADAYGHGLLESAQAALQGGASWLGTAKIAESLALRAAGVTAPTFAWLWTPQEADAAAEAVAADIDLSVSSLWQLDAVREAVEASRHAARIHLKIDTGLNRNGANVADWPDLVTAAAKAQAAGEIDVVGIWTHFAFADEPGNPVIAAQIEAYHDAVSVAARAGIEPALKHIANSAATLTLPDAHLDLVRPGIAVYGLSPVPSEGDFGLVPAMTLQTPLALTKRVQAGEGVSYGHQYTTTRETTLALVPLGYADGVPRAATNVGPVAINGERFTIAGRVCMDQFVVDVGDLDVSAGDIAVLFGSGKDGEPTAQDWADALDTIHYEIVTRIGSRVPRTYVGG
jgi:alanine racemase